MIVNVETHHDLSKLIQTNEKVIIDFWASFCGPCKSIAPFYENLAASYSQYNIKFAKANVEIDSISLYADANGISRIPTFCIFKNGRLIGQMKGANREGLENFVLTLMNS